MIRTRTDSPDLMQARIHKLLNDLANQPIEVPGLLHRVATLLELAAIQLRHAENGGRRVVWDEDQREAYRMRSSLEHWVWGMRFSDGRRDLELEPNDVTSKALKVHD